ncbi:MAG: hypothetical protein ACYTE8_03205, partial [Planctomycetota bacterium]
MINDFLKLKKCKRRCVLISALTICLFAIAGCSSSVSPQIEFDRQPYEPIINAEILKIDVVSINNALSSETVLEETINYYRPYIAGEIEILNYNYLTLDLGEANAISRQQLDKIINSKEGFGPTWI